jgi:hypothetical protein
MNIFLFFFFILLRFIQQVKRPQLRQCDWGIKSKELSDKDDLEPVHTREIKTELTNIIAVVT